MHYDELLRRMEAGMSNQVPAGGGGRGNHQKDAFTIARLPPHVREANRSLYEPTVVSIGPYHMSSSSTLAMKAHKWDMLRDFLRRGDPDGKAGLLAACIKAVRAMEPRARRCYGQIPVLGGDDLVELLVLDGCFVLQFLLEWSESIMQGSSIYVYYDLLLVENQMPLFVLAKLFSLVMGSAAAAAEDSDVDQRLLQLIFGFFSLREPLWQVPAPPPAGPQFTQAYHLLHLQYQRIVMTPEHRRLRPLRRLGTSLYSIPTGIASFIRRPVTGTMTPLAIPCVTALQEEFGVTFKEKLSPASQFDVTFRRGTMEIPRLVINGGTRILLANLFALEQTKDCWNEGTMTGCADERAGEHGRRRRGPPAARHHGQHALQRGRGGGLLQPAWRQRPLRPQEAPLRTALQGHQRALQLPLEPVHGRAQARPPQDPVLHHQPPRGCHPALHFGHVCWLPHLPLQTCLHLIKHLQTPMLHHQPPHGSHILLFVSAMSVN